MSEVQLLMISLEGAKYPSWRLDEKNEEEWREEPYFPPWRWWKRGSCVVSKPLVSPHSKGLIPILGGWSHACSARRAKVIRPVVMVTVIVGPLELAVSVYQTHCFH